MPVASSTWWTDQRIDATVTRRFVLNQLRPEEQQLVDRCLAFGDGLTDNTYLDWILEHAKRLFLILVDIGTPDQIFGLVDESYDDADLPIAPDAVKNLKLSYHPDVSLDKRFYKTQFRFLVRSIREGDHTHYASGETIPVESLGFRVELPVLGGESLEKVRLSDSASKVFAQKKIALGARSKVTESDVLREVATLKKLKHEHLVSVHASYGTQDTAFVLLAPAAEYTLKSFLQDTPKPFESLTKVARCELIINWPHCLANGLAWLHAHNQHHGAIRPSNVFINNEHQICLGQFHAFDLVRSNDKASEVEIYQYAPPEKWKRSAAVQSSGSAKRTGHSGGRTTRKASVGKDSAPFTTRPETSDSRSEGSIRTTSSAPGPQLDAATLKSGSGSSTSPPLSTISEGSVRGHIPKAPIVSRTGRTSTRSQPPRSKSAKTKDARLPFQNKPPSPKIKNGFSDFVTTSQTPSTPSFSSGSNNSSNSGSHRTIRPDLPDPIAVPASDVRAAVVQTWNSDEYNAYLSDIFALGCISIDILSFFCKRSYTNFARHRSAKNRTAGRGGGLADASFHANLGQVLSWCKGLEDDAKKKAKKQDRQAFAAVKPMLVILIQCIEQDPEHRLQAGELQEQLSDCIWKYANVRAPHCSSRVEAELHPVSRDIQSPRTNGLKVDYVGEATRNSVEKSVPNPIPSIPHRDPRRLVVKRQPAKDFQPETSFANSSSPEEPLPLHYQQFLTSDKPAASQPYVPIRSSSRQAPPAPVLPPNFYSHSPMSGSSASLASSGPQNSYLFPDSSQRPNGRAMSPALDAHPGKLWDPSSPLRSRLRENAVKAWPLRG